MQSSRREHSPAFLEASPGSSPSATLHRSETEIDQFRSASSHRLRQELDDLARTPITVCIVGPSGTGKSGLAAAVHARSSRSSGPCVTLDLASVPPELASSAIFGHAKGAFTDAKTPRAGALVSAHGGTLLLDEITKAPRDVQYSLLRAIEHQRFQPTGSDREVVVDVRFVAMTSEPLAQAVREQRLVPDLFQRLRNFVVQVSALAQRREDIDAVLEVALRRHARAFGYDRVPRVERALLHTLQAFDWPGNHRQVDAVVQRLLASGRGAAVLCESHLPSLSDDEVATVRSKRAQYELDRAAGLPIAFASNVKTARHYRVDRGTVRRWRLDEH